MIFFAFVALAAVGSLISESGKGGSREEPAVDPATLPAQTDGRAACYEIEKLMNALATFTTSTCIPTKGRAGAVSFIVLSDASVFGSHKAEKAWLLVAVGAVGSVLNDRPSLQADEVLFSDMDQTRRRLGYVLPAESCRSLQRQSSTDQIDLSTMYASIRRQLAQREVTR